MVPLNPGAERWGFLFQKSEVGRQRAEGRGQNNISLVTSDL